jgi:RNase adapter protein RapZ
VAEIVVITGLSGAGRSAAAGVLEDLGFYVVDNLPTSLVPTIVELAAKPGAGIDRLVLVSGRNHSELLPHIEVLKASSHRVVVLYLDASTQKLVQRYEATRRRHPFDPDGEGVLEAIERERVALEPVKGAADLVIDTTDLNVHQLKDRIVSSFSETGSTSMQVSIESFGYKHGIPLDADIVMDVRFLPNPHWNENLRPLTGRDEAVKSFVLGGEMTTRFLSHFEALLRDVIPSYQAEGRNYLTIAIGCTGGRHRSVAIVEHLVERLASDDVKALASHRDVDGGA